MTDRTAEIRARLEAADVIASTTFGDHPNAGNYGDLYRAFEVYEHATDDLLAEVERLERELRDVLDGDTYDLLVERHASVAALTAERDALRAELVDVETKYGVMAAAWRQASAERDALRARVSEIRGAALGYMPGQDRQRILDLCHAALAGAAG